MADNHYRGYIVSVLVALDTVINTLIGGRIETISKRIGRSILLGGWASKIQWPQFLRDHFINSANK